MNKRYRGEIVDHEAIRGLLKKIDCGQLPKKYTARASDQLLEALYDAFPVHEISLLLKHRADQVAIIIGALCSKADERFFLLVSDFTWILDVGNDDARIGYLQLCARCSHVLGDDRIKQIVDLCKDANTEVATAASSVIASLYENRQTPLRLY
jgi:hypothetical protein